jgi:hypothetical protein
MAWRLMPGSELQERNERAQSRVAVLQTAHAMLEVGVLSPAWQTDRGMEEKQNNTTTRTQRSRGIPSAWHGTKTNLNW